MKQLGIFLKQESSVIKKEEKKQKNGENKDYEGGWWVGP